MKKRSVGRSRVIAFIATAGVAFVATSLLTVTPAAQHATAQPTDWKQWGGDPGVSRYSPIAQITSENVSQLKPVWVYDPGTFGRSWEDTPLLVDGLLYIVDPKTTD